MTVYEKMKSLVVDQPKARERKNKNKAVGYWLKKQYSWLETVDADKLADMVKEANNLDRAWRKILEENPELRGSDYGDKEALEQEKQLELGYGTSLHSELKQ